MNFSVCIGSGLSIWVALAAAPALAQGSSSDYLKVYDQHHVVVARGLANEGSENGVIEVRNLSDGNPFTGFDPMALGKPTIVLESGNSNYESDIFGIAFVEILEFAFPSDGESSLHIPVTNPYYTHEIGQPIDATLYLSPALKSAGYTATFWSDAGAVPEPAEWAIILMGFGLAGTAMRLRAPPHQGRSV